MGSLINVKCDICGYETEFMLGRGMLTTDSRGLYYSDDELISMIESEEETKNYEKIDFDSIDGLIRCPKCKNNSLEIENTGVWD